MVLLLNNDFMPINQITIKKAVRLITKQKVEVIKSSETKLHEKMYVPKIVRLLHSISHLYSRKIPWTKQNVFIRDDYKCQYCGTDVSRKGATIDHVIPKAKGGKNTFINTVCACKTCNNWKGDKNLHDTSMKLSKPPRVPSLLDFLTIKFRAVEYEL